MLLPHSVNGLGQVHSSHWTMMNQQPITGVAMSHINLGSVGGGSLLPAIQPFPTVIQPNFFPRPPFPLLIRPFFPSHPSAGTVDCTSPKKKPRIFRPWDDGANEGGTRTASHAASHYTDKGMNEDAGAATAAPPLYTVPLGRSGQSASRERSSDSRAAKDDLETSKSAFEVFATNLGKSLDGHRCIYCGKMYSRKYGLKIHLRTHTGFKPLKCKVCQRPFGDPSNLNKHVRLHTDANDPRVNSLQQVRHEETHIFSPPVSGRLHYSTFTCPFCARTLVRKRDLERHLASRHPEEQIVDVERL